MLQQKNIIILLLSFLILICAILSLGLSQIKYAQTEQDLHKTYLSIIESTKNTSTVHEIKRIIRPLELSLKQRDLADTESNRQFTTSFIILLILSIILSLLCTHYIYQFLINMYKNKALLRQTNADLLLQSTELNQAQAMAKIGSWKMDYVQHKLRWSNHTYEIFEMENTHNPLFNKELLTYIHPDDQKMVYRVHRKAMNQIEPSSLEYRVIFPDKETKYIQESIMTVFSPDGKKLFSVGTLQDISDKIKTMQKQKAQSRLAQMGEMLSMIAHQWRQPLTSISAIASDVKMKHSLGILKEENIENYMDKTLSYTAYLSNTINDFKSYFKPDNKKSPFFLKDTIEKSLSLFHGFIHSEDIEIIKDFEDLPKIKNLENEIIQVLINIFNNALDAVLETKVDKGIIKISFFIDQDRQILEINDNAGGIKAENLTKIFEPYFSTKSKNGTGLGLYMSKIMIEEHCLGKMLAYNKDEGACFRLEFPL